MSEYGWGWDWRDDEWRDYRHGHWRRHYRRHDDCDRYEWRHRW